MYWWLIRSNFGASLYVLWVCIRLWDNKLEDEGVELIAKALRANTVLESIE